MYEIPCCLQLVFADWVSENWNLLISTSLLTSEAEALMLLVIHPLAFVKYLILSFAHFGEMLSFFLLFLF